MSIFLGGCYEKQNNDNETSYSKDIGVLIAGSDICYNAAADVFIELANNEGWNVVKYDSEYKAQLEKATIRELIAKKVDAIVVCTADIMVAGECTKLCEEANINYIQKMVVKMLLFN